MEIIGERKKEKKNPESHRNLTESSCLKNGFHNCWVIGSALSGAEEGARVFWHRSPHRLVTEEGCLYKRHQNRA